ncbi:hypothetical protein HET73_05140 [Wolbachia endosymbiont of Atemnus politus]|uniref:hypothetical protein n=1 Tax=Wolbachia endosymbiont of Atemnus politus TaxID=2682840 RepID=UPI001573C802|nr:hypothetical protein [Wolbachia endosymbiont of Atemnus politus]NSM56778.1 hypothetical protein [Wolbachia endosymbiont of Atemnus politus]
MRGNSILRDILEGKICGKRGRGRPRMMWLDDLKKSDTYQVLKQKAQNRTGWRASFV